MRGHGRERGSSGELPWSSKMACMVSTECDVCGVQRWHVWYPLSVMCVEFKDGMYGIH